MWLRCSRVTYSGFVQSQHVALIGDHKQLPPVITSPQALANGLGISLFERLTEERGPSF
jgi:superfamily I DNA and/or RNA helicase